MRSKFRIGAAVVTLALLVACGRKEQAPSAAEGVSTATPAASAEKTYPLRGRVTSRDPARNEITVAHERVEGLWEPMTMAFEVRGVDPAGLPGEGSTIRASLHAKDGKYWLTDLIPE